MTPDRNHQKDEKDNNRFIEINRQLSDHDRDLALVRRDIVAVQHGVEMLAGAVRSQDGKLDELVNLVRQKGTATLDDIARTLQVVLMGFGLISGVVAGIVYIAGNANRTFDATAIADSAVMKYRLDQTEQYISRINRLAYGKGLAETDPK